MEPDRTVSPAPPLIVVGGFYPLLTAMPLGPVTEHFRRLGRLVIALPHSVVNMCDVRLRAERLAKVALRLAAGSPGTGCKVDILGFSMGGLCGLYAIQNFGLAPRLRTLLTYGAPFQGTDAAYLGIFTGHFGHAALQMLPGSRLLRDMERQGLPPGPRYVSVSGSADYVCPTPRCRLPGAEHALVPFGHSDFLFNDALFAALAPYLE